MDEFKTHLETVLDFTQDLSESELPFIRCCFWLFSRISHNNFWNLSLCSFHKTEHEQMILFDIDMTLSCSSLNFHIVFKYRLSWMEEIERIPEFLMWTMRKTIFIVEWNVRMRREEQFQISLNALELLQL